MRLVKPTNASGQGDASHSKILLQTRNNKLF